MYDEEIDPESDMSTNDYVKHFELNENVDYELKKYERDSIKDIEKSLLQNCYKSSKDARDQLEYLENVANKIKYALALESKVGIINWSLRKDFDWIKSLSEKLGELIYKLK